MPASDRVATAGRSPVAPPRYPADCRARVRRKASLSDSSVASHDTSVVEAASLTALDETRRGPRRHFSWSWWRCGACLSVAPRVERFDLHDLDGHGVVHTGAQRHEGLGGGGGLHTRVALREDQRATVRGRAVRPGPVQSVVVPSRSQASSGWRRSRRRAELPWGRRCCRRTNATASATIHLAVLLTVLVGGSASCGGAGQQCRHGAMATQRCDQRAEETRCGRN